MQKGKELHEQKIEPIEKPEKSETDESGFYKY
jgi:hypothetical protein